MKFIKKNKLLILIFFIALFIRLYNLNIFPLGFHVDEAKVAWESYSILRTGRDDHGNVLALYYNSFGDYRPTGIFYATIPSLIIFGRSNFAVRFPGALLGALTVFPLYFISLQITKRKSIALWGSLLLSVIPWSITTSRATSEVIMSCFLILCSLSLLTKKPKLSFILLIISFLFYHSARVMGPVLMLVWIGFLLFNRRIILTKKIILGFLITCFISLVLLFSRSGLARYNQVKLPDMTLRSVFINYTSYFDPNFLIGDIAKPFRYTTGNVGIVSIPIFISFLIGIFTIIRTDKSKILLLLFLLSPIPASLTLEDSPNLHRAFFMLPFLIIISGIGIDFLWQKHKFLAKVITLGIFVSFVSFSVNYLSINNNFAFKYRDPQTKRLSTYIANAKNNYDKIYVTNQPDSPYPWYGFFNNIDPEKFNSAQEKNDGGRWQYENIIWDKTKCPAGNAFDETKKDKSIKKIMVIDNGSCFTDFQKNNPEAKIIKEFDYNGQVNYRVWEYQPTRN